MSGQSPQACTIRESIKRLEEDWMDGKLSTEAFHSLIAVELEHLDKIVSSGEAAVCVEVTDDFEIESIAPQADEPSPVQEQVVDPEAETEPEEDECKPIILEVVADAVEEQPEAEEPPPPRKPLSDFKLPDFSYEEHFEEESEPYVPTVNWSEAFEPDVDPEPTESTVAGDDVSGEPEVPVLELEPEQIVEPEPETVEVEETSFEFDWEAEPPAPAEEIEPATPASFDVEDEDFFSEGVLTGFSSVVDEQAQLEPEIETAAEPTPAPTVDPDDDTIFDTLPEPEIAEVAAPAFEPDHEDIQPAQMEIEVESTPAPSFEQQSMPEPVEAAPDAETPSAEEAPQEKITPQSEGPREYIPKGPSKPYTPPANQRVAVSGSGSWENTDPALQQFVGDDMDYAMDLAFKAEDKVDGFNAERITDSERDRLTQYAMDSFADSKSIAGAIFLSILLPGMSQFYVGKNVLGFAFICLYFGLAALTFFQFQWYSIIAAGALMVLSAFLACAEVGDYNARSQRGRFAFEDRNVQRESSFTDKDIRL